jgi:hypothetical protein
MDRSSFVLMPKRGCIAYPQIKIKIKGDPL